MDPKDHVFKESVNFNTNSPNKEKHSPKGSRTSDLHMTSVLGTNVDELIKTKVAEVTKKVEEAKLKKKQEESLENKPVDESTKNVNILESLDTPSDIYEFALLELDI